MRNPILHFDDTRKALVKCYPRVFFLVWIGFAGVGGGIGCALFAGRPAQEMSFTAAAIRAAKEVQADTLAPELYRQAKEWYSRAQHEYKFKNFKLAKEYAEKARFFGEQAEFESLRNGGDRGNQAIPEDTNVAPRDKAPPSNLGDEAPVPTPRGTPADVYEQRKSEDEARKKPAISVDPPNTPLGGPPGAQGSSPSDLSGSKK